MMIFTDSEAALNLAKNQQFHSRAKHIDVAAHWIREVIRSGKLHLEHIAGDNNIADGLTKPLEKGKFNCFVQQLGM